MSYVIQHQGFTIASFMYAMHRDIAYDALMTKFPYAIGLTKKDIQ